MRLIKKGLLAISVCAFVLFTQNSIAQTKPTDYVDPYIGTGGHGHTFLGVAAPFGAVQIGLNNFYQGWDWSSGYHYSDFVAVGFSHLHLSGTGCTDSGDIILMPYTGTSTISWGSREEPEKGYASFYSHDDEVAKAGYYSVLLKNHNVKAELTATERVAYHRYTYLDGKGEKYININLREANGDSPTEGYLELVNDTTVCGYRYSDGWTKGQQIYFTAIFSHPVSLKVYANENEMLCDTRVHERYVKGNVVLPEDLTEISVKVGISPVSVENAAENIRQEIPAWNFDGIVAQTTNRWDEELGKLKVETNDEKVKRIFYTGLYHAFLQPAKFNDHNNDYRGSDKNVYKNATFTNYTVFSLWDTYRTAHPLYTLVQPERVSDFINSFIAIYEEKGMLPVWHLYGGDTYEMIGIQSVPVIADAIMKGFTGFDYEKAYTAMKNSMLSDYKGLKYVREKDYIPSDKEGESVAKALEYAIADWGVAQVAKKLGKTDDYNTFSQRAKKYQNYWDPKTNFFRGKLENGSWRVPFDPLASSHRDDDYCEGTAWQYTWLVSHDVEGLISLFGSEDAFVAKLDSIFTLEDEMTGHVSPDISGLIGQYAHGNEPGHQTIYLYPFVGQQWKSAERAREVMTLLYRDEPNGLEGNEDCGQMSSWFVMSSLGFYPVNPSNGVYIFGSPMFDKATLALPDNKTLEITAKNNSKDNIYIQSVKWNGGDYTKSYINHSDIANGGKLEFVMGATPNKAFGAAVADRPKSEIQ